MMKKLLILTTLIAISISSGYSQLLTNAPNLAGSTLPAEFSVYVTGGSGYASLGAYQGRDSLLIGTTGNGNIFSFVTWDLTPIFATGVTSGTFKFSIYDAYGGPSSPYYMHLKLDSGDLYGPESIAGFTWNDSGWRDPNFQIGGPNLSGSVSRLRTIGWQDFEVNWSGGSVSIQHNGSLILNGTLTTNTSPKNIAIFMHNYYGGSQQMAVSGLQVIGVPEPSTYALLLLSGAASLWALKRRKR